MHDAYSITTNTPLCCKREQNHSASRCQPRQRRRSFLFVLTTELLHIFVCYQRLLVLWITPNALESAETAPEMTVAISVNTSPTWRLCYIYSASEATASRRFTNMTVIIIIIIIIQRNDGVHSARLITIFTTHSSNSENGDDVTTAEFTASHDVTVTISRLVATHRAD